MLIPLKQVDDNITGIWSILLLKKNALSYIKIDTANFIASFFVVILVILFQNYIAPIEDAIFSTVSTDGEAFKTNIGIQTVILIINWFLWPILAYFVCRLMDLQNAYLSYVTIYNWSSAVTITIITLPFILYQLGMPEKLSMFLILASMISMFVLKWRVIRISLHTNGLNASIMLFIDIAFKLLSASVLSKLIM